MNAMELKRELTNRGYIHIPFPNKLDAHTVTDILGANLFTTLIKENPKSTRLLSSNRDVDLHTDHIKARFVAWQCNSQAAIGGESVLVDGFEAITNASADILNCLENIYVKSHRLFFDDKAHYPLLSVKDKVLYYASFLCETPIGGREKQAYDWFQNKIISAKKIEIKLSEGDWLIIDNHRMLHGRKGFATKSNRLLTRYWLSGQANI